VAGVAARPAAREHGAYLLAQLAVHRCVGAHPRRAARTGPGPGGPGGDAERRDHRQPERQDDGKRGFRGYDGGKKIKGRKRHSAVDTLGLLLTVVVHAANIQDRDGAQLVIVELMGRFPRLTLLWADGGYRGKLVGWVASVTD